MGRTAIHPGEHLAEQLDELGMSAAALARNLDVPTNRNGNPARPPGGHRGHGLAPGAFLRNQRPVLDESAKTL